MFPTQVLQEFRRYVSPRKPCPNPVFKPHSKFTLEEDLKLRQLVTEHGLDAWRAIAQSMPGRSSRQCRERWLNYLHPYLNTRPWTIAEDQLLEQTYEAIGPRWVYMTKLFPNRTDGMIKNRMMALLRKNQRIAEAQKICSPKIVRSVQSEEPEIKLDSDLFSTFEDPFGGDFTFGTSPFSF
jgi:hypothetical protein